jgi:hypothetical protein
MKYKCLYNHELLILFSTETPYQSYEDDVTEKQIIGYVEELRDTSVDAIMCCPQVWQTPAYYSEIDRKWQDEAPHQKEPLPERDWKYFDKAYYRMRRYMLCESNPDPVALTLKKAKEMGLGFFISYRMNENHYMQFENCPTHSKFWRERRDLRIQPNGEQKTDKHIPMPLNYQFPEVRERYFSLIKELVEKYDIDGFELDFVRSNQLFPSETTDENREVMTSFVQRVKEYLDLESKRRGKKIYLSARVPRSFKDCMEIGLDLESWDRKNLIDVANIHFYNLFPMQTTPKEFVQLMPNTLIYGEISFVTRKGKTPNNYTYGIYRYNTSQIYETSMMTFWDIGVDGIAFFNFAYTREHAFNDPRRSSYRGVEPPFECLRKICDIDYLRKQPKHYFISPLGGRLPVSVGTDEIKHIDIYIADWIEKPYIFSKAVLRLESDFPCQLYDIEVFVNGQPLERFLGTGELYEPLKIEALPSPEHTMFFHVPVELLKHGNNEIKITNHLVRQYHQEAMQVSGVELALYTSDVQ